MNLAHHMKRIDQAFVRAYRTDDWAANGNKCRYCRDILKLSDVTGDHVRPRSRGGFTHRENIKAACELCNKVKGSMSEKAFKRKLHMLPPRASHELLLAHISYRMNKRTERAEKRIRRYVGMI